MSRVIDFTEVSKQFDGRMALDGVNWSVEAGSVHGLIGANGAGKSTLLKLALGVLWPDRGVINVLGSRLSRENATLRQRMQYVAAGRALPPGFRVGEWMHYVSLLYHRWDPLRAERFLQAMEIDPRAVIRSLSTGTEASLRLAAVAAARPDLLLLDEATNGMDLVIKRQVWRLLLDMAAAEGTTLIIATHELEDVERLADAVSILYQGRFVLTESLDALKSHRCRLQVVAGPEWSPAVLQHPQVMDVKWQGRVGLVTLEGEPEPWSQRFYQAGALMVDRLDMDLAEVFEAVLTREGYTRDALAWDA